MGNRVWSLDEIKNLIMTNDKMVLRSLLKLYEFQTEDEKNSDNTLHHNGVGFNGCDAQILSSFAKFAKERGYLSPKQMVLARKKIMKYSRQIMNIANSQE